MPRVLGDHPQRLVLTTAPDEDRNARDRCRRGDGVGHGIPPALQAGSFAAEHAQDDLRGLLESFEAVGEGAELESGGRLCSCSYQPANLSGAMTITLPTM